jgi:glutathione S-transferase
VLISYFHQLRHSLNGEWFTATDIMIGSMFIWRRMLGGQQDRPKLEAYVDRLLARPAAPKLGG